MKQRDQRILHVDGDAYFASCEIALDPKLKGQPVFVGGGRRGDGIVIAANYVAKKYGIKTGMACFEARRQCPEAYSSNRIMMNTVGCRWRCSSASVSTPH